MILEAAKLVARNEMSRIEFSQLVRLIGTENANIRSHTLAAAVSLRTLWKVAEVRSVKEPLASEILRAITRFRSEDSAEVLDEIEAALDLPAAEAYLSSWRSGHFL